MSQLTSLNGRSEAPVTHQTLSIDELRTALSEHLSHSLMDMFTFLNVLSVAPLFFYTLSHSRTAQHSPRKKKQKFMLYFYSSSFFSYTQFLLIEQFNFRQRVKRTCLWGALIVFSSRGNFHSTLSYLFPSFAYFIKTFNQLYLCSRKNKK